MCRRALVVTIAILAGALLAWRRRRARAACQPSPASSPASPVAPVAPSSRFVSVPWTLVDAPPEQAELSLRYRCTGQMQLDRVDVQETPTQVFVTVLVRWTPPTGESTARQEEREATVTLSRPLGSRALVRAPVDLGAGLGAPPSANPGAPPLYP
jgi:hypothetical protein